MKREFGMNAVRVIGVVFLAFLTAAGFVGNSFADAHYETGAGSDLTESAESSATEAGYCVQDAHHGNEEIVSVSHVFNGTGTELEVKVSLKGCGPDISACWISGDVSEHVTAWIDWNENGRFGRGTEENDAAYREEAEECVMKLSRPVSGHVIQEDGSITITFSQTVTVPEGQTGEKWMRVSLSFLNPPGNSCNPLGSGDVWDEKINLADMSGPDISLTYTIDGDKQNTGAGVFSVSASDSGHSHTYTLVSGEGDTDNGRFRIEGNVLNLAESFGAGMKDTHSIPAGKRRKQVLQ